MSHLSPQPHFDIPDINLSDRTLDTVHHVLSNFSAGLETPVLAFHLRGLVALPALPPLLAELEKQGRAKRHRHADNTPEIWQAIATTPTEPTP